MDQEVIDYCRKEMNSPDLLRTWKQRCSNGFTSGASFIKVMRDVNGFLTRNVYIDGACHAPLFSSVKDVVACGTYCLPYDSHGWEKEDLIEYYRYIANDGPMAHVFVTKDAEDMIENGAILRVDVIGAHLLMACQQTRLPWEMSYYREKIKAYSVLTRQGVHPNLAAIISWSLGLAGRNPDYYITEVHQVNVGCNHSPWSWYSRNAVLWKRVLSNEPINHNLPLYKERGRMGVFSLFDNRDGGGSSLIDSKLIRDLNAVILKHQPVKESTGIRGSFGYKETIITPQDFEACIKEMAEVLLAFEQKIMAEPVVKPKRKYVRKQPPVQPVNYPRPF